MKTSHLTNMGYRWECTPAGWKVFFNNVAIGAGCVSEGKCKHRKARARRKMLNHAAARDFVKVDFVKRRVSE